MNAPKESGGWNVSELCPWGRSQELGRSHGLWEERRGRLVKEAKPKIETKDIRRGSRSLDQEKNKTHFGLNSLTDSNNKVSKTAQF